MKLIKNILITTMLPILGIVIFGSFLQATVITFATIYQILAVSTVIHLLLLAIHKLEIKKVYVEMGLEYLAINVIFVSAGFLFNWYATVPILVVVIIILVVYIISVFIDSRKIYTDMEEINNQIKTNKEE